MLGHVGHPPTRCSIFILFYSCYFSAVMYLTFPGRALNFSKDIDAYTGSNQDLHGLELEAADWEAISLVAGWLKAFHSVTTEMSRTRKLMISTVHAIFRGL